MYSGLIALVIWLNTHDIDWDVAHNQIISSKFSAISPEVLATVRLSFAAVIWYSIVFIIVDKEGINASVSTVKGYETKRLKHWARCCAFTVWSFILQGVYFSLTAYSYFSKQEPTPLMRTVTWIIFEVSFPISFLVSTVVKFVLIPQARKNNVDLSTFFKIWPVLMHNGNIMFMTFEILVNRLPFNFLHFQFALVWGMVYTFYAWIYHYNFGYYYYFFLNHERKDAILWYGGLMLVLLSYFCVAFGLSYALEHIAVDHTWFNIVPVTFCVLSMQMTDDKPKAPVTPP